MLPAVVAATADDHRELVIFVGVRTLKSRQDVVQSKRTRWHQARANGVNHIRDSTTLWPLLWPFNCDSECLWLPVVGVLPMQSVYARQCVHGQLVLADEYQIVRGLLVTSEMHSYERLRQTSLLHTLRSVCLQR